MPMEADPREIQVSEWKTTQKQNFELILKDKTDLFIEQAEASFW